MAAKRRFRAPARRRKPGARRAAGRQTADAILADLKGRLAEI